MLFRFFSVAILSCLFLISCKKSPQKKHISSGEFDHLIDLNLVPTDASGIDFQNTLRHDLSTNENLFNFDYFYNGAGVGIADLNNDGLPDIFFCGNQVDNKLYLNQGDFVFKDISEKADINRRKGWTNGITFADVNQDGWLDIYLSQGGPIAGAARRNLLYLNQKNNTFTEAAQEYGLADENISTQSVFFDADKDGDLDCFVMNESEFYGLDPISFFQKTMRDPTVTQKNSCHFFLNDNGHFVNNTAAAGVLYPSFGLGLAVSDFNNDGWPDIYVANDYYVPDALYLNNKKGKFVESIKQFTNQQSFYSMGMDIADLNNDGRQDIFVLDMAANDHVRSKTLMASMSTDNFNLLTQTFEFPYQYMFNTLQLKEGNGHYSNIAHLTKTAKTDWSWSVLLADFNNNTHKDIFVTNGYRRYALDNDVRQNIKLAKEQYQGKVPLAIKENLYRQMPSEKLPNVFFANQGQLKFNQLDNGGDLSQPSFSNGAAVADLDNDGDLDLVINNMDSPAFIYQNETNGNFLKIKNPDPFSESLIRATIFYGAEKQIQETHRVRGYLSASTPDIHFGLGAIKSVDSLIIEWPDGKTITKNNLSVNQTIEINSNNKNKKIHASEKKPVIFEQRSLGELNLVFRSVENEYNDFSSEILLPYKQSTLGPCLTVADFNNDGQMDVFTGGAAGYPARLFIQKDGKFNKIKQPVFQEDAAHEDLDALFFDADSDGDQDLYVISGGNEFSPDHEAYQDRLYENDGDGNFSKSDQALPDHRQSGKTVAAIDYDKDGDLDLLVGNRIKPQHYPLSAPSFLYENKNGQFEDVTAQKAVDLTDIGIINKIHVADVNQDGWMDFMAVGEWTGIEFFINRRGTFERLAENKWGKEKGWWLSIHETDINRDGLPDFIIGNFGENSKYKASSDSPLRIFAHDFDQNGTLDIVLSNKYKGAYVPFRGKECSTQQMPFIEKKFATYESFANASLKDVYGELLEESYNRHVNNFQSLLLINRGAGEFEKKILPRMAQMFPILDVVFQDLNDDQVEDAILIGNIYDTEVETPRLDAGNGLVLFADPVKENYFFNDNINISTQLYLPGDCKALELLTIMNKKFLLTVRKNDLPLLHRIHQNELNFN